MSKEEKIEKEQIYIPIKELQMSEEDARKFIKRMRIVGNELWFLTNGDDEEYIVARAITNNLPSGETKISEIVKAKIAELNSALQNEVNAQSEKLTLFEDSLEKTNEPELVQEKVQPSATVPPPSMPEPTLQKTEPEPKVNEESSATVPPPSMPEPTLQKTEPEPKVNEGDADRIFDKKLGIDDKHELTIKPEEKEVDMLVKPFYCENCRSEVEILVSQGTDISEIKCPICGKNLFIKKKKRQLPNKIAGISLCLALIGIFVAIYLK